MSLQTVPPAETTRIEHVPGILGGEAVVKGTRLPVASVVIAARECGELDSVLAEYPELTAEAVADALAYELVRRAEAEVDAHIADLTDETAPEDTRDAHAGGCHGAA